MLFNRVGGWNMKNEVSDKFVKHGLFWFITRLIVVVIYAGIIFSGIIQKEDTLSIVILIIISVVYMMVLLLLPSSLIKKTAAKITERDFQVDWWCLDGSCYLMIDTHKGSIAAVWATNPFKIQIIDAAQLTDAKTTVGIELANRKTTNRIGVKYWIGKKKYYSYTFCAGMMFVALVSKLGQEYIKKAGITCDKLLMAKEVALRHGAISRSEMTLENLLSREKISQVNSLISEGRIIEAIRIIRDTTGFGLAQAKEIVDNWEIYCQNIHHRL
jgi:ribosomal protein L7/L12